jgi:hypothetical protein
MPLSISCSLVQSHLPRFTTPQQQNEAKHARIVNQELTQDHRSGKNARHTPVRAAYLSRVILTNSHLLPQGTDTVHGSYIGTLLPKQYLTAFWRKFAWRLFARGPPAIRLIVTNGLIFRARGARQDLGRYW